MFDEAMSQNKNPDFWSLSTALQLTNALLRLSFSDLLVRQN